MKRALPVLLAAVALSSCTWVDLNEEASKVSVITGDLPDSCMKTGESAVSVLDKVLLERSSDKVAEELETLARNQAVGRGDAIMAISEEVEGEQTFAIYRCSE